MRRRIALSFLGGLVVLSFAAEASAQTRVVVADFSGPGGGAIRNQAVRGLSNQSGIELVASDDFEAAGGMSDIEGAAAQLGVGAVLEGRVARRGRRWIANVTVRSGSGEEIDDASFVSRNLRGLGASVRRQIGRRLGDAIRNAEPPPEAAAAEPEPVARAGDAVRVVVRPFEGPGADRARSLVVEELGGQASVELVDSEEADETADDLGVDLGTPDGRVAVAQRLRVNAWVDGSVDRRGRRAYAATVQVTNGADGFLLDEAEFRGRNAGQLVARLRSSAWRRLGPSIEEAQAPPPRSDASGGGDDEDFEDEEDWDEDEDVVDSGPSGPRPPAFQLAAGLKILRRDFSYKDDIFGQMRPYSHRGAPVLSMEAHWYPGAHFTDGAAANLGLDFRAEVGVALESADSSGVEYPTDTSAWSLGARYRIGFGEHELAPLIAYGTHSFQIDAASADNPKPEVPDVDYDFVRLGMEGRFQILDVLAIRARLAWLHVTSAGEIESEVWFPRLSLNGAELSAGIGYAIAEDFEVRADLEMRRYFYTMNPEPEDPWIAGGALDRYIAGSLGVAWVP